MTGAQAAVTSFYVPTRDLPDGDEWVPELIRDSQDPRIVLGVKCYPEAILGHDPIGDPIFAPGTWYARVGEELTDSVMAPLSAERRVLGDFTAIIIWREIVSDE